MIQKTEGQNGHDILSNFVDFFLLQLRRLVLRGRFRRLQNREICKPRFSSGAGLPHIRIWRHGGRFADCTHPSALAASLFGRDAGSDDHRVFRRLAGRQAVARPPVGLLRYAAESQWICVPAVFSRVGLGLPFHRRGFPSHGPSPVGLGSHDSGLDPVWPCLQLLS